MLFDHPGTIFRAFEFVLFGFQNGPGIRFGIVTRKFPLFLLIAAPGQTPMKPRPVPMRIFLDFYQSVSFPFSVGHDVSGMIATGPCVQRQRDGIEDGRFARAGLPGDGEEARIGEGRTRKIQMVGAAQGVEIL